MYEISTLSSGSTGNAFVRAEVLDFFRRNFPARFYSDEAREKMFAKYSSEQTALEQLQGGRTWLLSRFIGTPNKPLGGIVWMDERNPGQHHIGWVITDRDHRRRGVGRALLEQAEIVARDSGNAKIMTASIEPENVPSIGLFEVMGYSPIPEGPEKQAMGFDPHGLGVDLAYAKDLD
ncbi:MAG: GNAT family N-acetyltransferase [Patescibacteria group bacterium]